MIQFMPQLLMWQNLNSGGKVMSLYESNRKLVTVWHIK